MSTEKIGKGDFLTIKLSEYWDGVVFQALPSWRGERNRGMKMVSPPHGNKYNRVRFVFSDKHDSKKNRKLM